MNNRRYARITALNVLYQRQIIGVNRVSESLLFAETNLAEKNLEFAQWLSETSWENRKENEELIRKLSTKALHMKKILLALGWMSVNELMLNKGTDTAIIINETIEICKRFIGNQYAPYLNGILQKIR